MRLCSSVLWTAVIAAALPVGVLSQDSAPAQPPAEVQVAREFKAAAPDLFRRWLEDRPSQLKKLSHGQMAEMTCTSGIVQYCTFIECQDPTPPAEYRIDVKKTDSVLTPFVGLMFVPVKMTCTVEGAFPWGNVEKRAARFAASVGASYDQCLEAGMKPVGFLMKVACHNVMGLGTPFSYEGEEHVTYRWTDGKWEFQDQHEEPPLHLTGSAANKAAGLLGHSPTREGPGG